MATERFGHYFKYFPTRTYDSFDGTTQHKSCKGYIQKSAGDFGSKARPCNILQV